MHYAHQENGTTRNDLCGGVFFHGKYIYLDVYPFLFK